MKFSKYEAAGNTYIIMQKDGLSLTADRAVAACSPTHGVGSDGVITWRSTADGSTVVIFNPDGSTAEKSGNGLRILATHLFDGPFSGESELILQTAGGPVRATRQSAAEQVLLEMGQVVSQVDGAALAGSAIFPDGVQLDTPLGPVIGYPVSIGNPHFVVLSEDVSAESAQKLGPLLENHSFFANRSNIQFVRIPDYANIVAEIWERGAGYTLSSGSSSCAIAAVTHRLGLCGPNVAVSMPGGKLSVSLTADDSAWLTGPVNKTVEGVFIW